jgi:hypothetical protein
LITITARGKRVLALLGLSLLAVGLLGLLGTWAALVVR